MSERKGTKALELWCKRLVKDCPNVKIDNMTTSWRNGIAFCALVHHFRPDLIDVSSLKPENIYENNQLAYSIAEKHLGIPSLLDPEDMVDNEIPDRLSILTYLSQFYQRLGHTVNTKATDSDSKPSAPSPTSTQPTTPLKFGKACLDKCVACGLPVYLAQRLIVSYKLYHRRCFRCSKCSGHLNPKNVEIVEGTDFTCDSCKNEKSISKFFNNNEQMGMLAFSDDLSAHKDIKDKTVSPRYKPERPLSIIDKINMFEKNAEKDTSSLSDKLENISLKDTISKDKESSTASLYTTSQTQSVALEEISKQVESQTAYNDVTLENYLYKTKPERTYKSNVNQFTFLQTQLAGDAVDSNVDLSISKELHEKSSSFQPELDISDTSIDTEQSKPKDMSDLTNDEDKGEKFNVTDDTRMAAENVPPHLNDTPVIDKIESSKNQNDQDIPICVPPRRKKHNSLLTPEKIPVIKIDRSSQILEKDYPDHLNPFSDGEEEESEVQEASTTRVSTNPFGSSDEEEDEVPPIPPPCNNTSTPVKRLISAYNPFWSDGEEPSSDEDDVREGSSSMYKSSLTTSTPNLRGSGARRQKARAPPPPRPAPSARALPALSALSALPAAPVSLDDVASLSSVSSSNSTMHSDQKSCKTTPQMKKKRLAPTPPDSLSTASGAGSMDRGVDLSGTRANVSEVGRRTKGPAPGLPLPERREVKLHISPEELQVQLDMLETQQLGLERQGVLLEQMIRDKCEGDEAETAPQEEIEDLVIQLCELVNEKNDLFRKQTELMYLRRQQRLEQEQADIEHEIRIIQSRPAVNRIDADKAREEQLVLRLVQIVRLRDELVQQIDAERRRERQEDRAIALSIANKRAQRNSGSNSSSLKSTEVSESAPASTTHKKSKVRDKVKKQLKKAKHSLISKKKDDGKEDRPDKEKKK